MVSAGVASMGGLGLSRLAVAEPLTQRYPDELVEILDESFAKYRLFNASVEKIASGMRWAEGPVWVGDGRYRLVSDIPENDRPFGEHPEAIAKRWSEQNGIADVGRADIGHDAGNKIVPFGPFKV